MAATPAEWTTALTASALVFTVCALPVLALDHKPSLAPARAAVDRLWLAVALLISTIPTGDHR